jgi:hypothetical protein
MSAIMSDTPNGQASSHHEAARRLRIDDLTAIVLRNSRGQAGTTTAEMLEGGHSGRWFVLAAGMTVLLIWGTMYLFFRDWRAKYRARALYGTTQVVPTIEPLQALRPPKVDHIAWRDAVDQTRVMLLTVTGSNLLDVKDMDALRGELAQHVRRACAQPATAQGELAEIWNDVADRGEFLFRDSRSLSGERHPRPRIIPSYGATRVVPAIDPLRSIVPPGVDPGAWREAVEQTREMLLAVTDSHVLDVERMRQLRAELSQRAGRACDHPETAVGELTEIWNHVATGGDNRHPRPKILQAPETSSRERTSTSVH